MAIEAPASLPPPPSWAGCSINAGFGYGTSNIDHTLETFPGLVPLNA
jgi:hypothetical protein